VTLVLSVTRHRVPLDAAAAFESDARAALEALRARPGFRSGTVGRSTDDPGLWVLATWWDDVGSFRRALSAYEVKVTAVPVLATAIDEASAFEPLLVATVDAVSARASDRATDADTAGPAHG
jgi:quinol monooxygenase YgiN